MRCRIILGIFLFLTSTQAFTKDPCPPKLNAILSELIPDNQIKAQIMPLLNGTTVELVSSRWINSLFQGKKVRVTRADGHISVYNVTNRGTHELLEGMFYPTEMLNVDALKGLRVLDLGTGGGRFVYQLRGNDVEAFGLDIWLSKKQLNSPWFIRAEAAHTGQPHSSFDVIYSTYSIFSYETGMINPKTGKCCVDFSYVQSSLHEMHRILKPNGHLRMAGYIGMKAENTPEGVRFYYEGNPVLDVPGFKMTRQSDKDWLSRIEALQRMRSMDSSWDVGLSPGDFIELQKMP